METGSDAEYFSARAMASRSAAEKATDIGPIKIHSTLATAYDGLVRDARQCERSRGKLSVTAEHAQVRVDGLSETTIWLTASAAGLMADSLMRGANEAGQQDEAPAIEVPRTLMGAIDRSRP